MAFETARLTVRRIGEADAGFMLALLNDPGFVANIGDRGVRTIGDARAYIDTRILASYAANGFGSMIVASRADGVPLGTVGFVRREGLDGPDLGFAFLQAHTGRGYGYEAAAGLLASAPERRPLLAVTRPDNHASAALLAKLGFVERRRIRLPGHADESRLFRLDHA